MTEASGTNKNLQTSSNHMIYQEEPENFKPIYEIASCFVEHDDQFLLLYRLDNKSEGNKWGVPAGKIERGEEPIDALHRELQEETGYNIPKSQLDYFKKIYVKYPTHDFIYHMFHTRIEQKDQVKTNPNEHKSHDWFFPQNALELPLVRDLDACIKLFYEI